MSPCEEPLNPLIFAADQLPQKPTRALLREAAAQLAGIGGWIACFDLRAGVQVERAAAALAVVAFYSWGGRRARFRLLQGGK